MRVKAILLVPFTGVLLVAAPGSRACPRRCACYVSTEVHCTFRYLTSIPDGIPPNVERINLGYNSLVRLTGADFSGLSKLELLLLHSNGIHTIADGAFSDLRELQVLKMSYNKVRKLQKDTFSGLGRLARLHMDHNDIEFVHPEAFYGLGSLRLVQLEGNRLTKLHPDTFVSRRFLQIFRTSSIRFLYLSDNFLPTLPREMLAHMPHLESLYLHGNPWVCDCRLQWLPGWTQEKPDVIKCKKERGPSGLQQCPACMNPQSAKGTPLALVPAATFLCVKPAIDPSPKSRRLTLPEDGGSASISPQDFLGPLGSLTLNLTDQFGNKADVVCSVQKPSRTLPVAFAEENSHVILNTSFSTFLVCDMDSSDIQPVWRVLALYSDAPLILERKHLLTETPQLSYKYKQVAPKPEDIFTSVEADLRADPYWLMQDRVSLQLNRTVTTLGVLQIQYTSDAQVTLPVTEMEPVKHRWTMISRNNDTKLEHTILVGDTITLACPGQGDPSPHVEWLLADGSKVWAPHVGEDGRILIDTSGKLELRVAEGFDSGTYHCISTNHGDSDVLTYRITVVEPHEDTHDGWDHHAVFAGDTLDLPCHATGTPDPSVSWVLPGSSVLSQSSGGKHLLDNGTLRILEVAPEDQGHYCCVAANPWGVDLRLFQVSVKMEGQRPLEQGEDTEGSGRAEPNPSAHPRESAGGPAPVGAEAGKQVSGTSKGAEGASTPLRREWSAHPRPGEHRRHLPASARRMEPRRWAALLERAKKKTAADRGDGSAVGPRKPASPPASTPGQDEGASGALPPGEGSADPAAAGPSAPAGTMTAGPRAASQSLVANGAAGTGLSPTASPPAPPEDPTDLQQSMASETAATSASIGPTRWSRVHGAASRGAAPVLPPLPGMPGFQPAGQTGRRGHFQRAPPATQRAGAGGASEPVSPTGGLQSAVTGAGGSWGPYSSAAHGRGASKLSSEPQGTAHPSLQSPRNSTAGAPLPRRFGRLRRIWGRGRIISPYRTPVLRRHGHRLVRPAVGGSAQERAAAPSAPERQARRPAGPPSGGLSASAAAVSFLGPSPSTQPKAGSARVTADPSAALVQNPSPLSQNKPKAEMEKTPPTTKHFSAQSTQGAPAGTVGPPPTSTVRNKPLTADSSSPPASSTSEARGPSGITPLPGPVTKPPGPKALPVTRFPGRKIPWPQTFVNNYKQKGILTNLHTSGLQKSTATELPRVSPALPTDDISPFPSTTFSARLMHIPPVTLAATHHSTHEAPRPGRHPPGKELPLLLLHPLPPTTASTVSFPPVPTAMLASPPSALPSIIYKTPAAEPRSPKYPREQEPPRTGNDRNISPGQSAGSSLSAATTPAPGGAERSAESVSAPTYPPLDDTPGTSSTTGLPRETTHRTGVTEEQPQETVQTWRSVMAPAVSPSSTSPQGTTARRARTGPPTGPPPLSSGAPHLPIPTSLPPTQTALADRLATPAFKVTTGTVVTPKESPRQLANPQQLAGVTTPPQQPDAKPTAGTAPLTYPSWVRPAPTPALVTVGSQDSRRAPLPWEEHQFGPKFYPEFSGKGTDPVTSEVPALSLPEATSDASNWDGQKMEKASRKLTASRRLPPASSLRNVFEKPRIVGGHAASFTVPAHSDAFLPCAAAGNPPPTFHWTRVSSGLELSTGTQNSRFQVLPNGTLSIQRVSIQDRGQYLCSASNPLGTDHLHVTLSVVSYPPRILEGRAEELTVHSGSTVELKCRAEGQPRPAVSWILANQSVVSESSMGKRQALVTPDGTLVIRHLSIYDRGSYRCVASNPAGQDSRLVRIQVVAAPPVILEPKRQVLVASWGESLELPCTAEGRPQPRVYWVLADGTEVRPLQAPQARLFLHTNGTLHIRNVALSDRGTYECIATSSTGSERRVVTLRVEGQESSPRIEVTSQKWTQVNWGDRLLLNCSAAGEPTPKITWRLPSKAVVDQWHRAGGRIHVYPNGSLLVASATERDGGDYLCVARNRAGEDLSLVHVGLRLAPARIQREQHLARQVRQGKDFRVDCRATGAPPPDVSWSLPDGRRVARAGPAEDPAPGRPRYRLFDNGTLQVREVGLAQEGDYTCHARNALGRDDMRVRLAVLAAGPRIARGSQTDVRVAAGDTALLDCEVVGEPRPSVFWLLPSGHAVSSSSGRYALHANGSLAVLEVRPHDSGEYVCVARSPGGGDARAFAVAVAPRPPLINGVAARRTVVRASAARHSRALLHCRAEGRPPPRVRWVLPDGAVLAAPYRGGRVAVHANGTLEIRNARLSDAADFTCLARGAGGESELVVRLAVHDLLRRPSFRSPSNQRVAAALGRPAALNCSADGNPPPEIIWMLANGTRLSPGPDSPHRIASNGSLLFRKTTRQDAGRYRCAARNQVGYIEKLVVLEIGRTPVILTYAPRTVSSVAGDSLWLHCVSDGTPKPRIRWTTPSGSVLDRPQGNGKYTLHANGTLAIKAATAQDRGNYVCQAQNSVGQALITVPVTIVAYPPRITNRPPRSILTRTGVAFQLHCVALGIPKPEVTWDMPGHSPSSRARELLHPQGTLVLENPQTSDSGLYRCTARNALGSDHAATYVQVI